MFLKGCMHGLQACLSKYITVVAFCIYLSVMKMLPKGGWMPCIKKSWKLHCCSWKIMEGSWNYCVFLISVGTLIHKQPRLRCAFHRAFSVCKHKECAESKAPSLVSLDMSALEFKGFFCVYSKICVKTATPK